MRPILMLIPILGLTSFVMLGQSQISQDNLKTTCEVLYQLTDKAIDNDRKDLIAVYYNAYKAIRLNNEITDGCDRYFDEIRTNYGKDIGNWNLGLDFPPKYLNSIKSRGFTHKEIETFTKFKELNLTLEDLEQVKFFKGIQENTVDLKLLKTTNTQNIKLLNDNLNKLKIETIDYSKLNQLSNHKLNIEQFQKIINK
ncbi:hypothetical protein [Tenacibaculum agarivorans]|uniref:hypothetical protein n=1 Tax=Tenacibaculum agarivorans TaxID=1908389 RepID=UPI000AEF5161|nr:hypothetical protein [Tenacibaculum agarivorans]